MEFLLFNMRRWVGMRPAEVAPAPVQSDAGTPAELAPPLGSNNTAAEHAPPTLESNNGSSELAPGPESRETPRAAPDRPNEASAPIPD